MVEAELLATIIDVSSRLTLTVVLLFMLITERKGHDETRRQHRQDIKEKDEELVDVLKEIAGIKANMWNVQTMTRQRESDTRPLRMLDKEE